MAANQIQKLARWLAFVIIAAHVTGCIAPDSNFEPGRRPSRGIPLSRVMESAAASVPGPADACPPTVENSEAPPDKFSSGITAYLGSGEEDHFQTDFHLAVAATQILPLTGDIKGLTRFTLEPMEWVNEHATFGLMIGGGRVEFRDGSLPDRAADNPFTYTFGFQSRIYLLEREAFVSPYVCLSAYSEWLLWQYRHAVIVGNDTITSDGVWGAGVSVGAGVIIGHSEGLSAFGEIIIGGIAFETESNQGFANDVISNYGYFGVTVGIRFQF